MSDLSGRTLFKRIKPLIKVFVIVDSYLPRKLNNFLFTNGNRETIDFSWFSLLAQKKLL